MNKLMLSCRKVTELIEKKAHFQLSPLEKAQLKLHTSMCKACHNYEKQDRQINQLLEEKLRSSDTPDKVPHQELSEDVKLKILEKIQKKN
jgi:hypothetical protein